MNLSLRGEETGAHPCQQIDCRHHFAAGMSFIRRNGKDRSFRETEASQRSLNCMLQLDAPLTDVEIAEMFGVTKQAIQLIEDSGKKKMRKALDSINI